MRLFTQRPRRSGFTLVELLMVISILTILSSTILFALWGAQNDAKESRTQAVVKKIDALLQERWRDFQVRALRPPTGLDPRALATWRLAAIRETMRMEMPDRREDIYYLPVTGVNSSLWLSYRFQSPGVITSPTWLADTSWTRENEQAECLYMILANMQDGDSSALEFLGEDEVGDTDGDGMREILDGWGHAISFLRWAPGYLANWPVEPSTCDSVFSPSPYPTTGFDLNGDGCPDPRGMVSMQTAMRLDPVNLATQIGTPDPFDPLRVDGSWADANPLNDHYALFPLVFSRGRDEETSIEVGLSAPFPGPQNNPYLNLTTIDASTPYSLLGYPKSDASGDDITNHAIEVR